MKCFRKFFCGAEQRSRKRRKTRFGTAKSGHRVLFGGISVVKNEVKIM
jgi:hypothetical protein